MPVIGVRIDKSQVLSNGRVEVAFTFGTSTIPARSKTGISFNNTQEIQDALAEVLAGNKTIKDSLMIVAAARTLGLQGPTKPQGYKLALDTASVTEI